MYSNMDFLKRVGQKLLRNKTKTFLVAFLSVLLFVLTPDVVFADNSWIPSIVGDVGDMIASLIIWILFGLAKLFQELALAFLEFFIQIAEYNNFANEGVVKLGWTMVRDVANMFFVVALLVIAFANILGLSNYEMKKTLPTLFLMAILVNFSKLIAGVIIDAAHVFTMTFLNAIAATAGGNLVGAMHLGDVFQYVAENQDQAGSKDDLGMKLFTSAAMGAATSLLAAFTIGTYMLIMLIRMVVLWILIILSPIAFVAASLPKTKSKFTNKWWSKFLNHVLVAPVMVFFLWLAFATMGSGNIGESVANYGSISHDLSNTSLENVNNKIGSWDVLLSYIIAIGFLWAGLEFVQQMNVRGGQIAGKAKGAMKSAMTYAPRKAYGKAKKTASDYATLAGEKTKLNRLPIVGSQSAGKIKREAAVDQVQKRQSARERGIKARAKAPGKGGGGLAGKIAPSYESIAKEEITASNLQNIKRRQQKEIKGETKEEAREFERKEAWRNFEDEKDRQAQKRDFDSFDNAKAAAESDEHEFDKDDLEDLELEAAGNVGQGGVNESLDFLKRTIPGLDNTSERGMHMMEAETTKKHLKSLENFLGNFDGGNSELRGEIDSTYDELTDELDKSISERNQNKISRLREDLAEKLPQAVNRGMKGELSDILEDHQTSAPGDAFERDPERAMLAMKHGEEYDAVGEETNSELKDDLGDVYDSSFHSMNMAGDSDISSVITEESSDEYNLSSYASGEYEGSEEEVEDEEEPASGPEVELEGEDTGGGAAEPDTNESPIETPTGTDRDRGEMPDYGSEIDEGDTNINIDADFGSQDSYENALQEAPTVSAKLEVVDRRKNELQEELESLENEVESLREADAPQEEINNISDSVDDLRDQIEDVRDLGRNLEEQEGGLDEDDIL